MRQDEEIKVYWQLVGCAIYAVATLNRTDPSIKIFIFGILVDVTEVERQLHFQQF